MGLRLFLANTRWSPPFCAKHRLAARSSPFQGNPPGHRPTRRVPGFRIGSRLAVAPDHPGFL